MFQGKSFPGRLRSVGGICRTPELTALQIGGFDDHRPLTAEFAPPHYKMRLPKFIIQEMEQILVEWEAFAKSLYSKKAEMTSAALRDHAKQILEAIAADLCTEQSEEVQTRKSKGHMDPPADALEPAAHIHAVMRAKSGMDINEMASEYRALRASVLRLWGEDKHLDRESLQDMIRFNEAIDQALAESITSFAEHVDQSRNLLLGMLGHDMRNPLNAIALTAELLGSLNAGEEVAEAAQCLVNSGGAMQVLLDDLVDFSRRELGLGISIEVAPVDLGTVCAIELNQHRAAHPGSRTELLKEGDLHGQWDGKRLQQVLRNLLSNASSYGTPGEPVRVAVYGDENTVRLEVCNTGPAIDPASAERIFEPLWRGSLPEKSANRGGLGLGLYIVREIARAHGGEVELHSHGGETVFSVRLPRVSDSSDAVPEGE